MNGKWLVIGISIGIASMIPFVIILLAAPPSDEVESTFFLEGRLKDLSEDTMTINQSQRPDWLKAAEVSELDIPINLNRGARFYNCGPNSINVPDCVDRFQAGEVQVGTSICAVVRLIDGDLYAGKIFVDMTCNVLPRA